MSTKLRILHTTEYRYSEMVSFGMHRAMLRPREDHEIHILGLRVTVLPAAELRWKRDVYGNSIALISFLNKGDLLRIESEVTVDIYANDGVIYPMDLAANHYPFQYAATEQVEILPYRLPSYPQDSEAMGRWLEGLYERGTRIETIRLLERLNHKIFSEFEYLRREEAGVQLPCETLRNGSGSCRDYAVFMMEATRQLGFASRFVTGYIQMGTGQHGATHAWVEVYLPGIGWQGFDPTNDKIAGPEHVAVGVAREQEKAAPISGTWEGPADAFQSLDVKVLVEPVEPAG